MQDTSFDIYKPSAETTEEEKLFKFINEQVAKIDAYLAIKAEGLTFNELNKALLDYSSTHFALISLKNFIETRVKRVARENDCWLKDLITEIRKKYNTSSVPGSKYLGNTEILATVVSENKEEYLKRTESYDIVNQELEFVKDTIKMWESYGYKLGELSKNLQSEVSMTLRNL